MTVDDFNLDPDFHGQGYIEDYDYSPAVKPPKLLLIAALGAVILGGMWAVIGALATLGVLTLDSPQWWGLATYILTLLTPAALIIYLRHFQFKHSMPKDGEDFANFDSHATQRMALQIRKIAILGTIFSLFAILIMVWPIAQELS